MKINSEKLRREIKGRGHTLESFSDRLKMTRQGISIILSRQRTTIKTLTKIGNELSVDPKDLLI